MMIRKKFRLSHSVLGLLALLIVQGILVYLWPTGPVAWFTVLCAAVGGAITVFVATEVIEEVRNPSHMLKLLSVVVSEFVIFFAFEYSFLMIASTNSFPTLPHDPVSLLLHSIMIFVFNPLYLPGNFLGRTLLLINTACALGLVLFILQNIWQFRRPE